MDFAITSVHSHFYYESEDHSSFPFSSYDTDPYLRNEDISVHRPFGLSPFSNAAAAAASSNRDSSGASVASDFRTPPPHANQSKRESGMSFTDSYRTADSEVESESLSSAAPPTQPQQPPARGATETNSSPKASFARKRASPSFVNRSEVESGHETASSTSSIVTKASLFVDGDTNGANNEGSPSPRPRQRDSPRKVVNRAASFNSEDRTNMTSDEGFAGMNHSNVSPRET